MSSFLRLLVVCLLVVGILRIGWNEPLRYRLMSKEEISKLEVPVEAPVDLPAPTPSPGEWMWSKDRRTKLDGGGYEHRSGVASRPIIYGTPAPTPYNSR